MKPLRTAMLALVLATGCQSLSPEPGVSGRAQSEDRRVVVFSANLAHFPYPMTIYLMGPYGIVIRRYRSPAQTQGATYELFSQESGQVLATPSELEFRRALERLPPSAVVDFYDTCTISLCSEEDKNVLRYCDELGIAGGYYVMCTDFGSIGKKRPWEWKKGAGRRGAANGNEPIRSETHRMSAVVGSRH